VPAYNGRKESAGAKRSEGHSERERADEQYGGEQTDVRYGAGDARVIARDSGQVPALCEALFLAHTVRTHFNALLVRYAVLVQLQLAEHVDAVHA